MSEPTPCRRPASLAATLGGYLRAADCALRGLRRYVKYNDNLRQFGPALHGCKGNAYVTSCHVINSAIKKTSKLTTVARVYRGVAGGILPESFWRPNAQARRDSALVSL